VVLARSGRIRIDIDAAVIMTLGPFGGRIKSRSSIFDDRLQGLGAPEMCAASTTDDRAEWSGRTIDGSPAAMNGWCAATNQGQGPRSVVTIEYQDRRSPYLEQRDRYTPSGLLLFGAVCPNIPISEVQKLPERAPLGRGTGRVLISVRLPDGPFTRLGRNAGRHVTGDDLERRLM
jgi:hypothetical protein